MTTLTFDTHAFVKRLIAVGFSEQQAEVFADEQSKLIENRVATRQDMEDVRREMREMELRLKVELIRWIIGVAAGQAAFIIAILKLFPSR